jgi:cell wall assembly regulator SMI1
VETIELITRHDVRRDPLKEVGRGATDDEINEAEHRLGVSLPEDFKMFLRDFGWGGVGSWELFGLGADVPQYLDLVRVALSERTEAEPSLPMHLIPIMNDGGGNLYCLDLSESGDRQENPVVYWDHALGPDQTMVSVAADFASWLDEKVTRRA